MPLADPDTRYRTRIYDHYLTARAAATVPRTLGELSRYLHYFRAVTREHLPENRDAQILDLGCGYGTFLRALQEAGYRHVRGVDGSMEQVEAAKRLGIPGVEHGDLHRVLEASAPESVDVVICFDVLEHFTKSELVPLVDSVRRILKPGGRWLIHVPNGESPFGGRIRYGDYTHEQAFTRESLAQLLLSSGFASVACFEDRPVIHGLKSLVRAILWRLIRAVLVGYVAVETGAIDRKAVFSQSLLAVAIRD